MESTFEKVVNMISEISEIEAGKITEKSNLYEELAIDSLTILDIVSRLEEEWGFRLTDYPELLDEMETVGSLVFFLDNTIGGGERDEKE